jgi:hypothetical protein
VLQECRAADFPDGCRRDGFVDDLAFLAGDTPDKREDFAFAADDQQVFFAVLGNVVGFDQT